MNTQELIDALLRADPSGQRQVAIYVDSSSGNEFHPYRPHLYSPEDEEDKFIPYVIIPTGGIWDPA